MYSITAEEGGLEALIDEKKVYAIAEQYAAGGIHILHDRVFSGEFGSFAKHFENLLLKKKLSNIVEKTLLILKYQNS